MLYNCFITTPEFEIYSVKSIMMVKVVRYPSNSQFMVKVFRYLLKSETAMHMCLRKMLS